MLPICGISVAVSAPIPGSCSIRPVSWGCVAQRIFLGFKGAPFVSRVLMSQSHSRMSGAPASLRLPPEAATAAFGFPGAGWPRGSFLASQGGAAFTTAIKREVYRHDESL